MLISLLGPGSLTGVIFGKSVVTLKSSIHAKGEFEILLFESYFKMSLMILARSLNSQGDYGYIQETLHRKSGTHRCMASLRLTTELISDNVSHSGPCGVVSGQARGR